MSLKNFCYASKLFYLLNKLYKQSSFASTISLKKNLRAFIETIKKTSKRAGMRKYSKSDIPYRIKL